MSFADLSFAILSFADLSAKALSEFDFADWRSASLEEPDLRLSPALFKTSLKLSCDGCGVCWDFLLSVLI
ncbi:hypothetical protein [Bartonella sp. M0177]|uniref:hypothetical protein n=1 Tax=Bartonella sp. M0177 TaxID=2750940 RepID=UPI0035A85477